MHYIHVIRDEARCLVYTSDNLNEGGRERCTCLLNVNYLDDLREIYAALSQYTVEIDEMGRKWTCCDYSVLTDTLRDIIAAKVHESMPLHFMRYYARQSIIGLASCRIIPSGPLRDMYVGMYADEVGCLVRLFNKYRELKFLTGLYFRTLLDGVRGSRVFVSSVHCLPDDDTHTVYSGCCKETIYYLYTGYSIKVGFEYHDQCGLRLAPHFCMRGDGQTSVRPQLMVFESDEVVGFVHKALHKYL